MPTIAEMLRQGSFENPNNPYSSNLLADALRGSLSNAESLGRGAAVAPLGIFGDVNALAREYVTPRLPAKLQAALESLPAAPTTEAILANIPRGTEARRESSGMEQLGAAMNPVGPVEAAKGITKGLGAYGKLAGEAINDAMVYGRGPLAEVTPQPMRMDVWHGSPHGPFEKFDASKIGTGEGAQVYSIGHYLGEARGTGEEYRRNLSASKFLKENQFNEDGTPNRVVQAAFQMDSGVPTDEIRDAMSDVLVNASKQDVDKIIKDAQKLFRETENSGYLYKVDLPDNAISKMVEWETPLSEMDSKLASVIEPLQKQLMSGPNPSLFKNVRSVGDVIQYANAAGLNPHESLKAAGYPGIKYLDEQSRAAGKGTRNFVVFPGNEDLLTIKEINDKPLGAYK
jgi:hypothetical protein